MQRQKKLKLSLSRYDSGKVTSMKKNFHRPSLFVKVLTKLNNVPEDGRWYMTTTSFGRTGGDNWKESV